MTGLALRDPEALILHRGIRATVAMTTAFAIGLIVLDDTNVALFASFGAFSATAFADFGGRPAARTRAYLILVAVGVVLVALGTVVSEHTAIGAVMLAALTFAILLAAVFGGYFAAGGSAALLIFVIAVMVPAPMSALGSRELGWVLGGVLAIAAATLLWPVHEQAALRTAAAGIAERLGALVRRGTTPDADVAIALRAEVDALRDAYGRAAIRPAGPTERDQALVRLLDELQRAVSFATRLRPLDDGSGGRREVTDVELSEALAATFEHTARILEGRDALVPTTDLLEARDRHRVDLEQRVGEMLRAGLPPDEVAEQLKRTFPLRVLSHVALSCEADAILAQGGSLPTSDRVLRLDTPSGGRGPAATVERAVALLRPHLRPGSVAFRNAIRAAFALAAALVVAKGVRAEHGFWVVLGTLTVLKSSAMRTGITAVQALAGNIIGFVVAALVLALAGDRTAALWVLLPVAVFLAAWAPAAVHFVVGQASFALMVVILFNLISPEGWRTGLIRVESVALGAAVSLGIGAVFWPRGNRRALRSATAGLYRSVAASVGSAFAAIAPSPSEGVPGEGAAARAGEDARDAELRADAALFDLLAIPSPSGSQLPAWIRLVSIGRSLRMVGEGVRSLPAAGFPALTTELAGTELVRLADQRVDAIAAVADEIADGVPRRDSTVDDPSAAWIASVDPSDDSAIGRALATAWALEWVAFIDVLVEVDDQPLAAVRESASMPWWC